LHGGLFDQGAIDALTRSGKRQSARIVPTGSLALILRPPVSISLAALVTGLLAAGHRSAPVAA
jgi:hypothetical protein